MRYIDINCDVGEGVENEEAIFPFISSCNIACGGHAGDSETIRRIVKLAKRYNIAIGAHPSYPDKENFGRVSVKMTPDHFKQSMQEQLSQIYTIIREEDAVLHHIKPHGALYNDLAKDASLAALFLETIEGCEENTILYVPYQSCLEQLALQHQYKIKREAFADRSYNEDLSLVSRTVPKALLIKEEEVFHQLLEMIIKEQVHTIEGKTVKITADTYCIHGDTPNVLQILTYLTTHLQKENISIIQYEL